MNEIQSVKGSSVIAGFLIDGDDVVVQFHSGRAYRYKDVHEDVVMEMITADSPGQYFAQNIKPHHECIEEIDKQESQHGNEENDEEKN